VDDRVGCTTGALEIFLLTYLLRQLSHEFCGSMSLKQHYIMLQSRRPTETVSIERPTRYNCRVESRRRRER